MIIKRAKVCSTPVEGETRVSTEFAILPLKVDTGDTVWLEHVICVEKYCQAGDYYDADGHYDGVWGWHVQHYQRLGR